MCVCVCVCASNRKALIGVGHVFCLTPTDEDSHLATIVFLCFAIVCVCVCEHFLASHMHCSDAFYCWRITLRQLMWCGWALHSNGCTP